MEDLRDWIKLLEAEGELARVKTEVDWNLEMGAILRRVMDTGGPAILFEDIKDYKNSIATKMFCNGITRRTLPLAFRKPKDINRDELVKMFQDALHNPVKYEVVKSGPVKENKLAGPDIDLLNQFPVPKWHSPDGGRYMMTWCAIVTKDPDTGEHNVGAYRAWSPVKTKWRSCCSFPKAGGFTSSNGAKGNNPCRSPSSGATNPFSASLREVKSPWAWMNIM